MLLNLVGFKFIFYFFTLPYLYRAGGGTYVFALDYYSICFGGITNTGGAYFGGILKTF